MAFSVDSTLKDLIADDRAVEVLRKHFPNRRNDPRVQEVLYYSLRQIATYPEAGISQEKLQAVDKDLQALK
jgi:hypothetical protein